MYYSQWSLGLESFDAPKSIRQKVFVDELGMPQEEIFDQYDQYAAHLVIWEDDAVVAAARMYPKEEGDVWVDQIAVLPAYRKKFYGDLCTRLLLNKGEKVAQRDIVFLAPEKSLPYLRTFGFNEDGNKAGNWHIMRVKKDGVLWYSACGEKH